MSGKNTFKHGRHSGRDGGIVPQIDLRQENVAKLQKAIGRDLSQDEKCLIADGLSTFKSLRDSNHADGVTTQDVKRTLAAISKLPTEEAREAKLNCDEISSAEIDQSLWFECGVRDLGTTALLNPPAELIPNAAAFALIRLGSRSNPGGRPEKSYQRFIASFAVRTWRNFGQTDFEVWHTGEFGNRAGEFKSYRSPLLSWTSILFEIVDGVSDESQIRKLLKQINEGRLIL
jgi:hypothetical protein